MLRQKFKTYSGTELLSDIKDLVLDQFGFDLKKATSPFLTLRKSQKWDCSDYTTVDFRELVQAARKPVKYLPDNKWAHQFLLGKFVGVTYVNYTDSRKMLGEIEESWHHLNEMLHEWSPREIVKIGRNPEILSLHHALLKYPIANQNGLILSHIDPVAELLALKAQAASLFSTGLTRRASKNYRLQVGHQIAHVNNTQNYDFVITSGVLEKLGLGSFGEELDAWADLDLLNIFHCVLRPGGLLYLELPVGKDNIIFNGLRIYGILRIPMLISDFELIATFDSEHLEPSEISAKFLWDIENFRAARRTLVLRKTGFL
ncbi:unnamed protein product [Caenorhabditis angaria]|uniref:Uncharacterized protein n=1 Tax=Caenorhabditis angaria TaxID=860376 RepID=A0A9P1IS47_9PELO|nr:unnamed protein product [Caenorhabditis angaria]